MAMPYIEDAVDAQFAYRSCRRPIFPNIYILVTSEWPSTTIRFLENQKKFWSNHVLWIIRTYFKGILTFNYTHISKKVRNGH